ncbi:uncharacterized protein [Eurosta solidaginis]|uniref:uncharacterized protein n=1 Tax=Eurosta solidaginis TaxID=178769 RepID=UPI0035307AA0
MLHTPPRRSARLMNSSNNMDKNATLSPITETPSSIPESATRTRSETQVYSAPSKSAVTEPVHIHDGAPIASASQTVITTGTSPTPSHAQSNHGDHNYDEMEKRIAMLELHLKATQVQLQERESQNYSFRSTGLHNGSSAVTYASSVVVQSQLMLPQSTQAPPVLPQSTQTRIEPSPMPTNTQSNASTPFIEAPCVPPPNSRNVYNLCQPNATPYDLRYTSAIHSNNLFSAQSSAAPTSTPQVSGACNNVQYVPYNSNPPKKLLDLPEFSGRAEDWPMFYASFVESTATYRYSNFENNQRLQRCLKGDARETVKSLLIHPNNVNCILEQLKFRFERPEQLVRSQLAQVKEIAPISESMLGKVISFAMKVKNICALLESAGAEHHIASPMLLDELIAKLPMSKRIEWGRHAATMPARPTILHFSDWLTSIANVVCTISDDCQLAAREPKRRTVLHVDDTTLRSCPICQGQHKPSECKRLTGATVADRWTLVKSRRLCFACLNGGHITSNCRRRKVCDIDGCSRAHHKLLHESRSERPPAPSTSSSRSASLVTSRSTSPLNNARQQPLSDKGATVLSCSTNSPKVKLLYRILPGTLYGKQRRVDTYALLDEGSSITMMEDSLVKELNLVGRSYSLNVQWFGGHSVQEPATLVELQISGAGMNKKHKLRQVHAVRNLKLPTQSLSWSDLEMDEKEASQMPEQPHSGATPRLLIGIDNCHLGKGSKIITMRKHGPFAAKTELGCVVFGPVSKSRPSIATCLFLKCNPDEVLNNMVADFSRPKVLALDHRHQSKATPTSAHDLFWSRQLVVLDEDIRRDLYGRMIIFSCRTVTIWGSRG